jgi:hypothetical protein
MASKPPVTDLRIDYESEDFPPATQAAVRWKIDGYLGRHPVGGADDWPTCPPSGTMKQDVMVA